MEAIKSLFSDFNLENLIPDLSTVLGWVELLVRICVMAGPLLLLGFGLLYLLAPPKEANYGLGFRCWWGMASLEAWQYTQRLAGLIWAPLGMVLTIVMALICNGFHNLAPMDMVWTAVWCLVAELVLTGASCVAVNVMVIRTFDKDGYRRSDYADEGDYEDEEDYEGDYEEE